MKDEIGRRLRLLRTEKGLTQKGLASLVSGGLDYTYIGKIERGEQLPSLKILLAICQALGVSPGYFFPDPAVDAGPVGGAPWPPGGERERELLHHLRQLHPDDIPLATEIVKALNRHRPAARSSRKRNAGFLRAAEEESPYEKK